MDGGILHSATDISRTPLRAHGRQRCARLRKFSTVLGCYSLFLLLATPLSALAAKNEDNEDILLPDLGDSSSAIVSPLQEYELGRSWLKAFRSQVPTVNDPLLQEYLENLIYELATHSQLKDRRLEVVIVDNPTLNAFAVPGGVIGVHNGLFLNAENEDQLAAVLSHELAHLSQRHFARTLEDANRKSIPTMAAMLASLVLLATTGSEAGIAAMSATQAAALQSQLRFSRNNEREADQIGMQTMNNAGLNPNAVADMFEQMQRTLRYAGNRPPEFLLTHPVTESRIADARSRAALYAKKDDVDNFDFHLMRARVELSFAENPQQAIKRFQDKLDRSRNDKERESAQYGLVLALMQTRDYARADELLAPLLARSPNRIAYVVAKAELDTGAGNVKQALALLQKHLGINPGNHPLTMTYAKVLLAVGNPYAAERLLTQHVKQHPNDPAVWYLLAETSGLAGNIIGVHMARAEYFILNGVLDQAEKQLEYALRLAKDDYHNAAIIRTRIKDIHAMRKNLDF